MMYSELLKCDESELRELHARAGSMLRAEFGGNVANWWSLAKQGFSEKASHQRVAWDLYTFSRGKTHYSWDDDEYDKNFSVAPKISRLGFQFGSLAELSLKLTAMGY